MCDSVSHEPVMLAEVLSFLDGACGAEPVIVDGTLGLGGYSEALLKAFPEGRVFGLDRDEFAIAHSVRRLEPFGGRFSAVHTNFGGISSALAGEEPFDAFVFDLGVSNMQLTDGGRGFSFQNDGPLDMRMDPSGGVRTAADVLADTNAEELADIFWRYGGERYSRRIAARVEERVRCGKAPQTTGELVELIRGLLPAPVQRKMGGHPARRVFQALRIFVNDELGEIESMLSAMPALAAGGCTVVIVSYHSLEDRIVKHRFRSWEKEEGFGRVLTRHPLVPCNEETERNYKSRSAKLRAFRFFEDYDGSVHVSGVTRAGEV